MSGKKRCIRTCTTDKTHMNHTHPINYVQNVGVPYIHRSLIWDNI